MEIDHEKSIKVLTVQRNKSHDNILKEQINYKRRYDTLHKPQTFKTGEYITVKIGLTKLKN